jgi:hypothetical protein
MRDVEFEKKKSQITFPSFQKSKKKKKTGH